ncbi:hypothetical protein PHYBLDRAFT_148175 [Phycomyces blakesleeanus NRRL 1555(-)]|uniref:Uncharacterized protein n=1 Tax=Phycomyces blakesleeanus (strain ATCC 8743b / DSM 1359 / FGSC 10004 / NBRC 33097 / NRRL 1555) TaxID=763407 RepID=A0A167LRN3_PHYB8|nr:hypothetical protein PHYBLDRAFT_148175 [Phycomyces blakesleeanus NRRL 1555(-)]OAD70956.1 hypothetical protein PHYBLDRAFT_148175 [Phycomyces blakesleeanus NRRL 1555(-)]|eukprot:XP_018288996.1 hypothetical protein PHYBLDRAFT_148175 [Phycomyces blakesleeanus NRRL 1555(-)]
MTGIRPIPPYPSEEYKDLLAKMPSVLDLDKTMNPKHLPLFLLVVLLLPPVLLTEFLMASPLKSAVKRKTRSFLNSSNPAIFSANEAKLKWTTDVHSNKSPNKKTVANLLGYLIPKFAGEGIKKSKFRVMLHIKFRGRIRKVRKDPKADVDFLMKRNCSGLMIKSEMSVDESDDEFPRRPSKFIVKFNKLIIIDDIVKENLGSNIRQLLNTNLISFSEKPVPDDVASRFPPWNLRYGPQ